MASLSIFSIGMLRVITAASAPSASTQLPPSLRPTSRAMVANWTPVHSDVLSSPCVPCTVFNVGLFHSVSPLPEHSMKCFRQRISLYVRHRELAWTVDHSVHKKYVFGGIDGRNATVMTFEVQTRGGGVSQHLVQRGKAPGRVLIRCRKAHADFGFEL